MFALGVFCPWCNAIGAVVGLISGQVACLFVTVGAIIHRRPPRIFPTTAEGCDVDLFPNSTAPGMPLHMLRNSTIPPYSPEGLNALYHISPYLVPFFGFILSLIVSMIVSIITGCNRNETIDEELINTKVSSLCQLCVPHKCRNRTKRDKKVDKKLVDNKQRAKLETVLSSHNSPYAKVAHEESNVNNC